MTALIYTVAFASLQSVLALSPNTTVRGNHNITDADPKQGWTSQPEGRGTLDIIWSCTLTMFLCSWSILCLNVPGPKESKRLVLWRKTAMTVLGFLCPEIVFEIAFGQWLSARRSVKDMSSASLENQSVDHTMQTFGQVGSVFRNATRLEQGRINQIWTMKEAFFADMGGFVLLTRDHRPFPLDAQQLYYLFSKGYLDRSDFKLEHREMEEKNKVDALLRAITLCQILWFWINTIGRWVQGLVVTSAELTTMSFILCSLGTAFFWWHKPAGAAAAKKIQSNIYVNDILLAEGQPLNAWKRTPLEFISRKEWWWSRCWSNFMNLLRHIHVTFGSKPGPGTPCDRIGDSLHRQLPDRAVHICTVLTIGYFSVLFLGWNYSFPTRTEQLLWRGACLSQMGCLFALASVASLVGCVPALRNISPIASREKSIGDNVLKNGFRSHIAERSKHFYRRLDSALNCIRNNSVDKDPLLYIPLRLMAFLYVIGFFYLVTRLYILLADIIELRSLPASAYTTVNWFKSLPHLS